GKSWGMFASPFEPDLWLCLFILMMALAAIVTINSRHQQHGASNFILRFQYRLLNTIGILFEHCEEYGRSNLQAESCHVRIVIQLYILMVVVISNAYKGTLKSDFSVEEDAKTELQYFHELQDFQLYLLVETRDCEYIGPPDVSSNIHLTCTLNTKMRPYCDFYHQLQAERARLEVLGMVTWDRDASKRFVRKSSTIADAQNQTFVKCQNSVAELLAKGLEEKLAFVSTSEDFDYNWDLISTEMGKNSHEKIRLGHNLKVEDGFLGGFEGYSITPGLDVRYHHWVPDRLRISVSSGIYSLWERWDKIRFPKHGNQSHHRRVGTHTKWDSLSLQCYDVRVLFYTFVIGISVLPAFCLICEFFVKRRLFPSVCKIIEDSFTYINNNNAALFVRRCTPRYSCAFSPRQSMSKENSNCGKTK
ncbi:unnamed protein product, partial [Allacma fusca]